MSTDKKYLDYEGLQKYHSKLIKKLVNLEYDPPRMFIDKSDLLTVTNWYNNPYAAGEIQGLKEGMLITVGYELWQLTDKATFKGWFTYIGDKANKSAEELGWKVIGNNSGCNVDGHILKF